MDLRKKVYLQSSHIQSPEHDSECRQKILIVVASFLCENIQTILTK